MPDEIKYCKTCGTPLVLVKEKQEGLCVYHIQLRDHVKTEEDLWEELTGY